MLVWGKTQAARRLVSGVARAAAEGKLGTDLLTEAVRTLLATDEVDRAGVWVESNAVTPTASAEIISFRGVVAEKERDATPAEWSKLSPGPPLPGELLIGLQIVDQELDESSARPMIGALSICAAHCGFR
jgi:hypothetical protein